MGTIHAQVGSARRLTKEYAFGGLISGDTQRLLTLPAGDLTFVGDVVIRGRAAPTALWGFGTA